MALIQIMKRSSSEDVQRFEDAIYDAKEAITEICEIFEDMKAQFSERDGGSSYGERGYSSRGGYMSRGSWYPRDGHAPTPEWGERRGGRH